MDETLQQNVAALEDELPPPAPTRPRYDRSIVEGPLGPAVWKIAWPTMLPTSSAACRASSTTSGGALVGFTANAAIGVSWQIFLVVIVFISSLFTGMSVLVARFAGAGEKEKVDRTVYQAFLDRHLSVARRHGADRLLRSAVGCSTS